MKKIAVCGLAALACLAGTLGAAQAQQVQEYTFPSHDGSKSPPSTLRITEQPGAGAPSGVIRDTPESLAEYQRCRNKVDREAIGNVQLQTGVATCLKELEARRRM